MGEEDFSSCIVMLCLRAAAFTPPRPPDTSAGVCPGDAAFAFLQQARPWDLVNDEATGAFACAAARTLADPAVRGVVDGLQGVAFAHPCHPSYAASGFSRVGTFTLQPSPAFPGHTVKPDPTAIPARSIC